MKNKYEIIILCLFLVPMAAFCQAGPFAVSLEKDRVAVGEKIDLLLISLRNESGQAVDFPLEITCELFTGKEKIAVLATQNSRQEEPKQTKNISGVRQQYSFRLPSELQGQVIVSLADIQAPRVVLDVIGSEDESIATADKVYPTLDSMFALYQSYQKNIAPYQPVYFLVGTDPGKSKFQISFKYQIFDGDASFVESNQWIKGLYFGYTHTSFWDLQSTSAPFYDTSYKPELFWLSRNYLNSEHGLLKGLFLQSGFQHESNGKDAEFSRSTNYFYVKPTLILYDDDSKFGLQLSPKVWSYIENDDNTNPDLPDYRGYFDLEMKFGFAESVVADTHFYLADEGGSLQVDISYPLHKIFGDAFDVYFYAQYTNMLAESLLDYQQRTQAFRLGLAFIR